MGLSGFLYVAIVVGWAVYLVPFALKRYDEANRNRSIDRFSSAMRVLGRHEVEDPDTAAMTRPLPGSSDPQAQRAARKAARRRRRTLLVLVLVTAVVAGLAAAPLMSWWSVAAPGGAVLLWLMLCRGQARREVRAHPLPAEHRARVEEARRRDAALAEPQPAAAEMMEQTMGSSDAVDIDLEPAPAMPGDDEPTVVIEREGYDEGEEQVGSGSLWDPVPVTLPTYVHKPRAPRTIRTIDLGASDVQTSGRKYEESAIYTHHVDPSSVREQDAREAEEQATSEEHKPTRRAVGE